VSNQSETFTTLEHRSGVCPSTHDKMKNTKVFTKSVDKFDSFETITISLEKFEFVSEV
jgi:hypothetical protein